MSSFPASCIHFVFGLEVQVVWWDVDLVFLSFNRAKSLALRCGEFLAVIKGLLREGYLITLWYNVACKSHYILPGLVFSDCFRGLFTASLSNSRWNSIRLFWPSCWRQGYPQGDCKSSLMAATVTRLIPKHFPMAFLFDHFWSHWEACKNYRCWSS